jgi:hypothetical protein
VAPRRSLFPILAFLPEPAFGVVNPFEAIQSIVPRHRVNTSPLINRFSSLDGIRHEPPILIARISPRSMAA